MKNYFFVLFLLTINGIHAQSSEKLAKIAHEIEQEAIKLYKSEMASWYGSDLYMAKFQNKLGKVGGYFSYSDEDTDKCIFFSLEKPAKVLLTVSFNGDYDLRKAKGDDTKRDFTKTELDLYEIREAAADQIEKDSIFKFFKQTNLNLIPIIEGKSKKVYILTGPQDNGVVLIGNDYELIFDKKNKHVSTKKIHASLLRLEFSETDKSVGAVHSHLPQTGDFITATDICTLMLYQPATNWEQHMVISEKYVSIWNCKTNKLLILGREVWESINN
jgi:hypothetical protein